MSPLMNSRFPDVMYTPRGKLVADKLWQETMEELGVNGTQASIMAMRTAAL